MRLVGLGLLAVSATVRFGGGAAAVLGSAFLLARPPVPDIGPARPSRLRGVEWALPVALLVALFALFVVVSATTMFGSDEHVRATTGLAYAEYARSGFWQLLAVLSPERFVAEQDVARYAATGTIDVEYPSGLSADAVPAPAGLPEPVRSCALAPIAARLGPAGTGGRRSANASRDSAREILAAPGPSYPAVS